MLALGMLSKNYGIRKITLTEISQNQGLSLSYLEQLFASLKKAGIVKGVRGKSGGYVLKNPPEKTTIYTALETLEGIRLACSKMEEPPCLKTGGCIEPCSTEKLLDKIQNEIDETLKKYTLADI